MNQAFIDAQNLRLGTKKAADPWTVDLKKLRIYLRDKYSVEYAYYFIGAYDPSNQDLYQALQQYGYIVVFREHSDSAVSRKKGNVDTDIVFSIMKKLVEKEDFEKVILVSGDGDYWRMVDYLISKDRFAKLLAPNKKSMSSLYKRKIADTFRDCLDNVGIRNKIEYTKA